MLVALLVRLARTLGTLLVSSFLIFAALYLAPGSPIGFLTRGHTLPPQTIHSIEAQYHLNKPFLERYWLWLTAVLHGELGHSTISREPVATLLEPRLGVTFTLVALGALLIVAGGVALGVLAGVRGRRTDGAVLTGITLGMAIPSFVTATILINYLALKLGWFPVYGAGSGFGDRLWHLTLPAISLALGLVAYVALITRAAVRVEMGSDHSDTARGRGLREGLVIRRHVVRNALIPVVTVSGITVASLVAGVAVVETAYELPGIGAYLVQSVTNNDFPVVQAICLILVVVYVVVNAVVDMLYLVLDPRLREGSMRRRDWVAITCLAFLGLVALVAVLAPLIAPHSPTEVNLSSAYLGPSLEHPLGTDASGRDILSRVMFGARSSLLGPLGVTALAILCGVSIALAAAWFGGWADTVLSGLIDVLFSFPGLLLAIVAVAVFGVGLGAPVLALGIAYTPIMARVARSGALRERQLPYIAAATVLGLPARRIVWRHLLPNVWPLIVAQTVVMFGYATIDLAAISFLGLGVQPPSSDWGLMVAEGRPAILAGHSAEALYPGIALVLVVLSVMLLGRRLGDRAGRGL